MSPAKEAWTKQTDVDLGNRIEMLSEIYGVAISRGKGTDIPGKLYFYENGIWFSVFKFPYSDYPFIKILDENRILVVIHETHSGNYRPRMFVFNRHSREKKEIPLPKIMWDHKDFSMWKSISFFDNNKAWMVGQLGNLLFFNGSEWISFKSPVSNLTSANIMSYDLNDVSINKNGSGWAVGRSGIILRLNKGRWSNFPSPTQNELFCVAASDDSTAWIAGEKGCLLKLSNNKWTAQNIGTSENLLSIEMLSSDNIWVCGSSSSLYRFNGIKWKQNNDVKYFSDDFIDLDVISNGNNSYSIFLIGNDGIYSNSQNQGFSFSNITSEFALQRNGIFAMFFDANNDLFPDLFIKSENGPNLFYRNDVVRFSELSLDTENNIDLSRSFHSSDLNNDGTKDLILLRDDSNISILYGNSNFNFYDKSENIGIYSNLIEKSQLRNSIQSCDFDNDGNLDLYLSNYNLSDLLLKGNGAGNFIEIKNSGINKILNHESHGMVFSDFNNDNLIDVFIFYRVPANNRIAQLFINKGNFSFEELDTDNFVIPQNPIVYSAIAEDFNNDCNTDLLIFINENNIRLLINDGKANFKDNSFQSGFNGNIFHPEPSNGIIAAADINNDGYKDLFAGSNIYLNSASGYFKKTSNSGINFTGNPVFSDIDNDGDMDIFIGSSRNALGSGDRSALFRNNVNTKNFIKIKPIGSRSNRDAVGSKIFLFGYDDKGKLVYKTVRQNMIGSNPLSQRDPTSVHFGLKAGLNYKAKIVFPSGTYKKIDSIEPGNFYIVYEQSLLERTFTNLSKSISRTVTIMNPLIELGKLAVFIFFIISIGFFAVQKKYRGLILRMRIILPFFVLYLLLNYFSIFFGQLNSLIYSFGIVVPVFFVFVLLYSRIVEQANSKFISHYKIIDVIGIGGMGKVLKAIDTTTKNTVALKVINPTLLKDEENQKRLTAEGEILSSFNHPNIIKVFEVAKTQEHTFIAMEFLSGGNLDEFIQKNYPVKFELIKNILLQICDGLIAIHAKKVIHRDLKSANIMFDSKFNVRIMDFGLSKSPLVTTMTSLGTVIGTLGFVAPEQVTNIEVDYRTDIFSFGVIIYHLATNQLPFKGENEIAIIHSIFNTIPRDPIEINPELPCGLKKIIFKCLEKNPKNRYNSVTEIKEELMRL